MSCRQLCVSGAFLARHIEGPLRTLHPPAPTTLGRWILGQHRTRCVLAAGQKFRLVLRGREIGPRAAGGKHDKLAADRFFMLFSSWQGVFVVFIARVRAYAIMAMVYAWLDKEEQFARYLDGAKQLIQLMEDNPNRQEEIPLVGSARCSRNGVVCKFRGFFL